MRPTSDDFPSSSGYFAQSIKDKTSMGMPRTTKRAMVVGMLVGALQLGPLGIAIASGATARATVPSSQDRPRRQAAVASGLQLQREESDPNIATRSAEALTLIRVPWKELLPGWRIAFRGPRKGYLAMTMRPERRIEIYVRADRSVVAIAHDIAHELGHAVDVTYNTDQSRSTYLALRGLDIDQDWWTCEGCRDLDVPAGDFAESFAQWAGPVYRNYSNLGSHPDEAVLRLVAKTLFPGATADGEPVGPQT